MPLRHHVLHLTVHGVLHLLDYDHESQSDAEIMEGLEAEVLAELDRYGAADWQRERDRVQLAILKLADGDFAALQQHTDVACTDYRDVLAAAEYPAYSQHGWPSPSAGAARAEMFEADWDQYRKWLQGE